MSHFSCLVILERPDDANSDLRERVKAEVTRLLAPYDENDEWFREGSRWDWWVIGGRWTGALSGYKPTEDPANQEECELCHGTGTRPDGLARFGPDWVEKMKGCNGCLGAGRNTKWPTQWAEHERDVVPVPELPEGFAPYSLVTPDGAWHAKRHLPDGEWSGLVKRLTERFPDHLAVIVDCHI